MYSSKLWGPSIVLCFIFYAANSLAFASEPNTVKENEPPKGLARLGIRCSPPIISVDPNTSYKSNYDRHLDIAAKAYQRNWWGYAFREYKNARLYHPEDPRDPEVLLMIADCALQALKELHDIMPADLAPDSLYGEKALSWLHNTYGFYANSSEGESFWRYDMRALRYFLRLYPNHDQADEVAYALVKEDLLFESGSPATFMVRNENSLACARAFIKRYKGILNRYPRTEIRSKIESDIALLRGYIEKNGPLPESISDPW